LVLSDFIQIVTQMLQEKKNSLLKQKSKYEKTFDTSVKLNQLGQVLLKKNIEALFNNDI